MECTPKACIVQFVHSLHCMHVMWVQNVTHTIQVEHMYYNDRLQLNDGGHSEQRRSLMGTATAPARAMPIELQILATPILYSRVSDGISEEILKNVLT